MARSLRDQIRTSPVAMLAAFPFRTKAVCKHLLPQVGRGLRWLLTSRETTNYTYDLSQPNQRYLAQMLAHITGFEADHIHALMQEPQNDAAFQAWLANRHRESDYRYIADADFYFARRLGWYALIRLLKPRVVVETGVDKGLGATLICYALKRNADENASNRGHYYGTDIKSDAGYLLADPYAEFGTILYGDSITSLKAFDQPIDIFINDSDHSDTYEYDEYRVIQDKLSPQGIILGDNSHKSEQLLRFSKETNRQFLFFREEPINHWHDGAGIGFSFVEGFARPGMTACPEASANQVTLA
ncbi:MAG: class I SAM-dependent methyltransferase [Cyanobacteria bacterium HKST-UBA06]|nr:class I SAM-dependent methyltransferase [Cyanobacteria bacterium HKST-UBA06]MCA9842363.1 class I SAM-dependent methyltransferase [Cyanobacteria bacterium HKST-UBA03]